ncbi:MAG: sulfatase-like hydrolase/transferase [Planctomycetes bacterium]|nr:sulfatase-like hydrolase/transferase [Planctomycetota bacterium]
MSSDRSNRLRILWALSWPLLVLGGVLRIVLYAAFRDTPFDLLSVAYVIALGVVLDVVAFTVLLLPAVLGLTLFSMEARAKKVVIALALALLFQVALFFWANEYHGRIGALVTLAVPVFAGFSLLAGWVLSKPVARRSALTLFFAAAAFGIAIEFFFFEEFNSRYNHIALDYVLYPHEVATNIWESYPVPLFVGLALVLGFGLSWVADRRLSGVKLERVPWAVAGRRGLFALAALGTAAFATTVVPADLSTNRITSEIAQNGLLQLVRAFRTAELEYDQYYLTLPSAEARARAASVLAFPHDSAAPGAVVPRAAALQRTIHSARPDGAAPLDVVVVMVESLGSEFVGTLGAKNPNLTPEFDRWSKQGLLFENLIANGNRTVRGLEGILCSFVPLPGDSITKHSPPAEAATLGRVFANAGYQTAFFYGGAGTFDGMEPFMSKNGWHEFVEQRDYADDCFTTAWGVADEHIFAQLLQHQLNARIEGKPFFGTLMSVSNHKPYLVPRGRTAVSDGKPSRAGAVAYSDWAIGHWLDAARDKGLLEHTVVLIVGDHGARVYGRELIPVESYRIPALFLSPDKIFQGHRYPRLCSQIDLAPTLVALAGLRCEVPFLGRDLASLEDGPGRAFVQHNRDVGMLTDDTLVVLGLKKTVTFYQRDSRAGSALTLVADADVSPAMRELERDAAAVFQTAYETYHRGRYLSNLAER